MYLYSYVGSANSPDLVKITVCNLKSAVCSIKVPQVLCAAYCLQRDVQSVVCNK